MASIEKSTVIGVFESPAMAERAVRELIDAGFQNEQIGVVARSGDHSSTHDDASGIGAGALSGALAGAGLGALAGLGILAGVVPVIGPAIAGGTLGILLSNAAAGAGIAGLAGGLISAGVSEEDADYYEDEIRSGRTLVSVTAPTNLVLARTILNRCGAIESRGAASNSPIAAGETMVSSADTEEFTPNLSEASRPRPQASRPGSGLPETNLNTSQSAPPRQQSSQQPEAYLNIAPSTPAQPGSSRIPDTTLDVPVVRDDIASGRAIGEPIEMAPESSSGLHLPGNESPIEVDRETLADDAATTTKGKPRQRGRNSGA